MQTEVGVKSGWLDGRVQFTGAVFRAVKQNVLRPDPSFGPFGDNDFAVLQVGEIRNQGLELDIAGRILPQWNVAFNYAHLDSEIVQDVNRALIGRPMPPSHTAPGPGPSSGSSPSCTGPRPLRSSRSSAWPGP